MIEVSVSAILLVKVSVMVLPDAERELTVGLLATPDTTNSPGVAELSKMGSVIVRTIVPEVVAVEDTVGGVTSRVLSIARFEKLAREFAGVAVSSIVPDDWV